MSESSSVGDPVFDPEDLAILIREGTAIPDSSAAVHQLHKRRLYCSSDGLYSELPLPTPSDNSSSVSNGLPHAHYRTIPNYLISRETLLYLGFNETTADKIWSRWTNWGPDPGREIDGGFVAFISIPKTFIRNVEPDAYNDDDRTWFAYMDACGINRELQRGIMTPSCRDVRMSASCKSWLLDTMDARYASLRQIQTSSLKRGMAARAAASHPGGPVAETQSF